jgi:hypothetical protein
MAGFHRCRRRCEIQRWRSGIHKTSMETTFWMGVSDILEKADIFNSVWRILKRLIWLGSQLRDWAVLGFQLKASELLAIGYWFSA